MANEKQQLREIIVREREYRKKRIRNLKIFSIPYIAGTLAGTLLALSSSIFVEYPEKPVKLQQAEVCLENLNQTQKEIQDNKDLSDLIQGSKIPEQKKDVEQYIQQLEQTEEVREYREDKKISDYAQSILFYGGLGIMVLSAGFFIYSDKKAERDLFHQQNKEPEDVGDENDK
jgi:hypothetical protein